MTLDHFKGSSKCLFCRVIVCVVVTIEHMCPKLDNALSVSNSRLMETVGNCKRIQKERNFN